MKNQAENRLNNPLGIHKLPLNNTKYYELNQEQDWANQLLEELNSDDSGFILEAMKNKTSIQINLELNKKHKRDLGEYVIATGELYVKYATQCVRTLEGMFEELNLEIKAGFISADLADSEQFQDQSEAFLDNDVYELYFYEKNQLNIAEMLHEHIQLNINQYPVKNPDTPLPTTGKQQ
ncbi:MAG: hypothetical protein CME62_11070 [Halobacteriovoraceae bacterium]|nr:hypothetical protein [Halobacteriovoraceae bacterium]|tara:strand:+ start:304 stop:840 length:537 start_codon:yes stop_codon:yes gene_type:complete